MAADAFAHNTMIGIGGFNIAAWFHVTLVFGAL